MGTKFTCSAHRLTKPCQICRSMKEATDKVAEQKLASHNRARAISKAARNRESRKPPVG